MQDNKIAFKNTERFHKNNQKLFEKKYISYIKK